MSPKQPPPASNPARDELLAKALRENLRRRKASRLTIAAAGQLDPRPQASAIRPASPAPFWLIRTLQARDRTSGEVVDVVIEMTAPFPNAQGDSTCGIRVGLLDEPSIRESGRFIRGVDGMQAIELAVFHIQSALLIAQKTHELTWMGAPYAPGADPIWQNIDLSAS